MVCKDLDGVWMVRANIDEAKLKDDPDQDLPVEIFIVCPSTQESTIEGIAIYGLEAFVNLRNALNEEYERYKDSLVSSVEDIA